MIVAGCGSSGGNNPAPEDATTTTCVDVSATHTGESTYYNATGVGNCSFPASPDDLMVAALNNADYDNGSWCGACAEVTGPDGMVVVRIVDRCPGCAAGDLDLSRQAFERVAALKAGRVPVTWHEVACPTVGPMAYHWKDGANPFWFAVQVRGARHRITEVAARRTADTTWRPLARTSYNYFLDEDGLGEPPYSLRITDDRGQTVEDHNLAFAADTEVLGTVQFPACD